MSGYVEIHWTCGSMDEARKVCRYLVQERYVGCAQIIPWIESIYSWNNQLETAQEVKINLKTKKEFFEIVKDIIEKNCSYEVPEISMIEIPVVNREYLEWLEESTKPLQFHK